MFRFPKNPEIYKKWVQKCRRGDKWNPKTSVICSEHFTQDSFVRDLKAELLGNYFYNFLLVVKIRV
jgi:hypothetical protein